MVAVQGLAWVLVGLFCVGCISNRLDGPIHDAKGPPYIADGAGSDVAPIEIVHRVLLIGDAGLYLEDDPTLAALGRVAAEAPASTVLYLGDNVYNNGLQDDDRERGEKILGQQLEATSARKIVVPGNHDWGMIPSKRTAQSIRNEQAFVDGWKDGKAEFLPKDGCMGPVARRLEPARGFRKGVVAVLLDPTPWFTPALREICPRGETEESHLAALEKILATHQDDWVVVASHYPMLTGGPHGGLTYGFFADMIVGTLGWWMGGLGNTDAPAYADWIAKVGEVMREHPPAVYAAGHDHSLQVLDGGGTVGLHVVSGAGAPNRMSTVTNIAETRFAHAHAGFVVLDFGRRGRLESAVLRVYENGRDAPVFETDL